MACVLLKTMGIGYIVARANNDLHGITLDRIGVDKVIQPESEGGTRLAHNLFNPNLQEYLEMAPNFGLSRMRVPDEFVNKTLSELGFSGPRDKYGLAVLAVRRGREVTLNPDSEETLRRNDVLILAGRDELLEGLPS
jgi:trk system potassium uptake protein TrkA